MKLVLKCQEIIDWYDGIVQGTVLDNISGTAYLAAMFHWNPIVNGEKYYILVALDAVQEESTSQLARRQPSHQAEWSWLSTQEYLTELSKTFDAKACIAHGRDILTSVEVDCEVPIHLARPLLNLNIDGILEISNSQDLGDPSSISSRRDWLAFLDRAGTIASALPKPI